MRKTITLATMAVALAAGAAKVSTYPQLPDGEPPFAEVATNVTLQVQRDRLEVFSITLQASSCASNEVLVTVGHDADGNGDLSFDEASFVFGMDCGARYFADYINGTVDDSVGETIHIPNEEFNPDWNLVKIVKRGVGQVGEVVTKRVENKKFAILVL